MPSYKNIDENIINLINTKQISEQNQLRQSLAEQGHNVSQATLSRRLIKLNVAKIANYYKQISQNALNAPMILSAKISESGIIILHTIPGSASNLASLIDIKYIKNIHSVTRIDQNTKNIQPQHPENSAFTQVIGTIAGDDTVLVIIKSTQAAEAVLSMLFADFQNSSSSTK